MRRTIVLLLLLAAPATAAAQQSASYRMNEHVFNEGGRPAQGVVAASASYRMTIDAIGDGVSDGALSSFSFAMTPGFAASYPPPGEVLNVRFDDDATVSWDPEMSAGVYNVYRDALGTLPGGYGSCYQLGLGATTTTEPGIPVPGTA